MTVLKVDFVGIRSARLDETVAGATTAMTRAMLCAKRWTVGTVVPLAFGVVPAAFGRQQHGDEDLPPCCCRLRYGSTLVKPPPTPRPTLLDMPLVVAEPLPIEAAPLTELL